MKRINHLDVGLSDPIAFSRILSIAKTMLDEAFPDATKCLSAFICLLAFKYWHENISCRCNSLIEACDKDYIKTNWVLFEIDWSGFLYKIGKIEEPIRPIYKKTSFDDEVWTCFAKTLNALSTWVTHSRRVDENLEAIKSFFGDTNIDELKDLQCYYKYGRRFSRQTKETTARIIALECLSI